MTERDRQEFRLYLRQCTDAQVQSVYDKERAARRRGYMHLAEYEAERRGLELHR